MKVYERLMRAKCAEPIRKMRKKHPLTQRLISLLYPVICPICGRILTDDDPSGLCYSCKRQYRLDRMRQCTSCFSEHCECQCPPYQTANRYVDAFIHVVSYQSKTAGGLLPRLKRQNINVCFDFAAVACARRLQSYMKPVDMQCEEMVVTYVPRSPKNVTQTGYDQAEILAGRICHLTGIQGMALLIHLRGGKDQKQLNANQRRANARKMFVLRQNAENAVSGKIVVLVDDVVTTGASMIACARLLLEAGARSVIALSFAKTERAYDD